MIVRETRNPCRSNSQFLLASLAALCFSGAEVALAETDDWTTARFVPAPAGSPEIVEEILPTLQRSDSELGDFEATYTFKSRDFASPFDAGWNTTPIREFTGTIVVRRRNSDVSAEHITVQAGHADAKDELTRIKQVYFYEDGNYTARLDEGVLTYSPNVLPRIPVLPPFDAELGYHLGPDKLVAPSELVEIRRGKRVRLDVNPSNPGEEMSLTHQTHIGKWGVGSSGALTRFDTNTGLLESRNSGRLVVFKDDSAEFIPTHSYTVLDQSNGHATRLRHARYDGTLVYASEEAKNLAQVRANLVKRNTYPVTVTDLELVAIGPLSPSAPVSIIERSSEVAGVRKTETSPEIQWVYTYDSKTKERVQLLHVEPSGREWVAARNK